MNKPQKTVDLSIIILTYNSQDEIIACLDSIYKYSLSKLQQGEWEIIVIDNNSTDHTIGNIESNWAKYRKLTLIKNKDNIGFGPANNLAAQSAQGKYILFLNPDTIVEENSLSLPLQYAKSDPKVGAVSAKLVLGNGQIDMTCHRGFPTPWNALCHFSGLSRIFPTTKLFAGYSLGYLDLNQAHEVDAINGAYFMMPTELGRKLKFFDPDFFWKGEDLDLSYRIKENGYKIMYLPQAVVHHYKGSSQGHKRGSKTLTARFDVMRLFYDKHYKNKYPFWMRALVLLGIELRYILAYITGK